LLTPARCLYQLETRQTSSSSSSSKVVTVDERAFENAGEQAVDEDGFPVVNETPTFEAAVEQETQAEGMRTTRTGSRTRAMTGFTVSPSRRRIAFRRGTQNWSASVPKPNWARRRDAQSGRETSQRSGALSGVWSSRSGRRA
jgi:hypothetical protein